MVKSATLLVSPGLVNLQLATKDHVTMDTQRLRSDVASIFTIKVASSLQYYDKGIAKDAITEAVQSPESLGIIVRHFLSWYAVVKTIARFLTRSVSITIRRVIEYMKIIGKD